MLGCLEVLNGKITYFADQDAYDMRDCLVAHGWDASHIKVIISPTKSQVKDAIEWLDNMDDSDDIDLVMWTSHGVGGHNNYTFAVKDCWLYGDEMDSWLDQCGAEGICIIAESCKAGWSINDFAKDGRVILTSSDRDKASWSVFRLKNSVFLHFLMEPSYDFFPKDGKPDGALTMKELDANNDGWISAEEAFLYAAEKTDEYNEWRGWELRQNPQMYDGFDGDFTISYVG